MRMKAPDETTIHLIARLLQEGKSNGEVAAALGGQHTKGSVAGIIHRNGLARFRVNQTPVGFVKKIERQRRAKAKAEPRAAAREEPMAKRYDPNQPRPLMDLRKNECRYAVAENRDVVGRYLFCAKATMPEQMYCEHHRARINPPRGVVVKVVRKKPLRIVA